ncbi:MAG: hypothetical protein Q4F79_00350 [Eubacteriales bacterium]|nr:hypothetical protein [Eubacteriales bacterium]
MARRNARAGSKRNVDVEGFIGISSRFAQLNKLITRDLNNNTSTPTFSLYSKDDIQTYLSNPYTYEQQLRKAVTYIYGASSHFRRLIQYFVGLSDLAYVVEPYKIDPKKANTKTINNNYRKVLNLLSSMNIKTQFPKVLTVCLREDVFYGTLWVTNDSVTIQQLPSDYCSISTIEGNVPNVTFDFSYFDSNSALLEYYPAEFQTKYRQYQASRMTRWIELDSPTSFAIKCNSDILDYALPPFAGLLRELYDIEDYKQMKETKTALENYAMLTMKLPMEKDGTWGIDLPKAKEFWRNLDSVLPDEVGSVLSPMDINKISFEKSNTGDTDTVSEAEQHMFSAAGVSSLLFNNEKASSNALLLSIKADQAITYGIVKNIQDAINRFLQAQSYGKNFKVNFLNISQYNAKEAGDAYLKAASYGMPTISYYCASQGLGQAELDSMSFLETEVLGLQDMFRPLQSSSQISSDDLDSTAATDEGGAPKKELGEVSDSREINSEEE